MSLEERRIIERTNGAAKAASATEEVPERHALAVVVAGMHRSGTSAFARILGLLGLDLPRDLYAAREDNPLGYWEPRVVVEAHEEFLAAIGSSTHDVLPLPDRALETEAARQLQQRLVAALKSDYGDSRHFVLKDPRICRLVPLWLSVLESHGAAPSFVLPIRNPLEVAGSLKERNHLSGTRTLLLWLRNVLEAERDTRTHPRSVVAYEDLLRDWQTTMRKIATDLSLVWPRASHTARAEIEDYLSPRQRHHHFSPEEVVARPDVVEWVKETYEVLRVASAGGGIATDVLDAVRAELARADAAFGPLIGEYRVQVARAEGARAKHEKESRARAAALEREAAALREREASLHGEAAALRARLEELEETRLRRDRELDARKREIASLAAQLESVRAYAARLDRDRPAQEDAQEALRGRVAALEAEAQELQERLGEALADAAAGEVRIASSEADGEVARRDVDVAALRLELEQLQEDVRVRERALERQQRDLERLAEEVRAGRAKLTGAERELARERSRARRLTAELDEAGRLADRASRRADALAHEAERLRSQLASAEEQLSRRLSEHDALTAAREAALRDREEEIASLRSEVERLFSEVAKRDTATIASDARTTTLEEENRELETGKRELEAQKHGLQAEKQELEAAKQELEAELARTRTLLDERTQKLEAARAGTEASEAERGALRNQITAVDQERSTLEEELRAARSALDAVTRSADELSARVEDYEHRFEELQRRRWTARLRRRRADEEGGTGTSLAGVVVTPRRRRAPSRWWRSTSHLGSWLTRPRQGGWGYVRTYLALRRSGEFDADYYLARYPDVAEAGLNPLMHYVEHGSLEGREPGPDAGLRAAGAAGGADSLSPLFGPRPSERQPPAASEDDESDEAIPQTRARPSEPDVPAHGDVAAVAPLVEEPPADFSDFAVVLEREGDTSTRLKPLLLAHPELTVLSRVLAPPRAGAGGDGTLPTFFEYLERAAGADVARVADEAALVDYLEYLRCVAPTRRVVLELDARRVLEETAPLGHPFSLKTLVDHGVCVVDLAVADLPELAGHPRYVRLGAEPPSTAAPSALARLQEALGLARRFPAVQEALRRAREEREDCHESGQRAERAASVSPTSTPPVDQDWSEIIGTDPHSFVDDLVNTRPAWITGGSLSHSDSRFLFREALRSGTTLAVEIGTGSGFSTALLAHALHLAASVGGSVDWRVSSFDLAEHVNYDESKRIGDAARESLPPDVLARVEFNTGTTALTLRERFAAREIPFLFLDANHQHPWPTLDVLAALDYLADGGLLVLHDINLPLLHQDHQAWGVKHLFDALSGEKRTADADIPNIGSVRVPADREELRRQLVNILYGYEWQASVDERVVAAVVRDKPVPRGTPAPDRRGGLQRLDRSQLATASASAEKPRRRATTTHVVHDLGGFLGASTAACGGKRLRICLVDTILQTGGAEWFATQLAAIANAELFEFTVVTFNSEGSPLAERLAGMGIRVTSETSLAGEGVPYDEWKESRLFDLLERLSPDIVFFSSQYLCQQLPKDRLARLPTVVRISNLHEELERADFSWASAVICCSDEQFAAVSRLNADRTRLIRTGVDTLLFAPLPPERKDELKRRHGLEGKKVVLFVARLSDPLKRASVFEEVVRKIKARRDDVAFVVIGYFESHARVEEEEARFREFAVAEGVRWAEHVAPWEAPTSFQLADVLVSTSAEYEGLSNTVLQALSAGAIPVVTRSGGMGELVAHGESGFISGGSDAESIAVEVERALDLEDERRAAMVAEGRRTVETEFDLRQAALEYQRAFVDVYGSRPVRIAVTDGSFGVGGAEWLVALLIRNADPGELEFHLVVHRGDSPLVAWARDHGATVHVAPTGMSYTDWKRNGIETVLRRVRPDVVMPCTVTTWPEHEPFYRLLAISQNASDAAVLTKEQYEQADFFVCVSEDVRNQLDQDFRWKMTVLHNSIDVDMFAPDPAAREATRVELGIPPEAKVVLWCGRMHEARKRLDVLMEVIDRLDDPAAHFLVVGYFREGEGDEEGWRDFIATRGNVSWVAGTTPWETARYYAAANVYLSTSGFARSDFEGLSLATAQALAAGLPVVTTRSGGQHELVEDGLNGRIVDVADVDALVAALRELADVDGAATEAFRTRNRQKALAGFDIRAHVRTYSRLAQLLKRNVGPRLSVEPELSSAPFRFADADEASDVQIRAASSFLTYTWPLLREGRVALEFTHRESDDRMPEGVSAIRGKSDVPVVVEPRSGTLRAGLERAASVVSPDERVVVSDLGPDYSRNQQDVSFEARAICELLDYLDDSFSLWSECFRDGSHLVLVRHARPKQVPHRGGRNEATWV